MDTLGFTLLSLSLIALAGSLAWMVILLKRAAYDWFMGLLDHRAQEMR